MIPRSAWRSKRGRSNRGAIAVITALLMVPMIGLIGLAIGAGI